MAALKDRITELTAQNKVTGIDFIYVYPDQQQLDIYFLTDVAVMATPLPGSLTPDAIRIHSNYAELPLIGIIPLLQWPLVDGQPVLRITTLSPGDFALYQFQIEDVRIDPFFNDVSFSFKANCPSDLDCKPPEHECPPEELVDFPIDYLARDFWSFRRALLDFASLRYPKWLDRLEADAGIMMAELMSAAGDEMAYYQDRINREAYLETATQRRSMRAHAHLVDYYLHDGRGASTWLDIQVGAGMGVLMLSPGTGVYAAADDNTLVHFEIGNSIRERLAVPAINFKVDIACNVFKPHIWDDDLLCLPVGSTELYLEGDQTGVLHLDDLSLGPLHPGKWVLLQTNPVDPAQPARAQMVRITSITKTTDPVFLATITHVKWEKAQATRYEFDLKQLSVKGNMVPATAGKTETAFFLIGKSPESLSGAELNAFHAPVEQSIERAAPNGNSIHLKSLPGSIERSLVFLGKDLQKTAPEIILEEMTFNGVNWVPAIGKPAWECRQTLVGIHSSAPFDRHYLVDDGSWLPVVNYQRAGYNFQHRDYASGNGVSIRFGDGEFGRIPDTNTVFRVRYRLGTGTDTNVAAAAIHFPESSSYSISNPLPAIDGLDAETANELRQSAPEAFRAITYRAVRPEDYAEAAERLPWVQKAGAVFHWTGSWLTAFVTPDPKGKLTIDDTDRADLMAQLNRFRQAGREVHISDPVYANIDLRIGLCIRESAYAGHVKARVMAALMGTHGIYPKQGYFSPDRFSFGTPLDRSTLEAWIQDIPGVKAVEHIRYRRRGWFDWQDFTELSYDPGKNVIIRIANDPLHPERGILTLQTHGGL
ncbi:hypothetical protein [Flavihumibacter fluvii]|uniref:hypothetical protein n=1 Tax=Flavihumibacter fluvii TaxID=2838157 RepID=UPI001BDE7D26|nr:hypothetical protein [Flavihumibacter fluvii]ULQ53241.1 hypothetical protein KJS93_02790 [Flavihumibacter fluvii]